MIGNKTKAKHDNVKDKNKKDNKNKNEENKEKKKQFIDKNEFKRQKRLETYGITE